MSDDINKIFTPNELIALMDLDLSRVIVERDGSAMLDYEFEIKANEFIKFAELDLQQETTQGLVNALSNAKRAIDCQVDTVLGCFGLLSRRNFPQKMDVLREMGIVTPRIVNKVVKARNYLEHEFKEPEQEQVEDAVDIATLFVISLEQELRNFNTNFLISTIVDGVFDEGRPFADKWLSIEYSDDKKHFSFFGIIFDEVPKEVRKARKVETAIIRPKEKGFIELMKLAFNLNRSVSEKELKNNAIQFIKLFSEK
jgi:hypothetical protein